MRRFVFVILIGLFLLPLTLFAQDTPVTTEEPQPASASVGQPAAPTVPPPQPEPLPTAIGAIDATPVPVSPLDVDAIPILVNARADLELLATQALGNPRPNGWSGSNDTNNPQLAILIRLDLELLVGTIMGASQRPDDWFGPVASSTFAIARDIRHDLELLADRLNPPNVRPPGWAGADPLMRCTRGVQNLVDLLEKEGIYHLSVDINAGDFCNQAELQASHFVETSVLSNGSTVTSGGIVPAGSVRVNSRFAVAFLSRFGSQAVGTIPLDEIVTPVARSYTQFSKMILVRGAGFEVFMDYRSTTLSDDQFLALDNIDTTGASPVCSAGWCKAPSG